MSVLKGIWYAIKSILGFGLFIGVCAMFATWSENSSNVVLGILLVVLLMTEVDSVIDPYGDQPIVVKSGLGLGTIAIGMILGLVAMEFIITHKIIVTAIVVFLYAIKKASEAFLFRGEVPAFVTIAEFLYAALVVVNGIVIIKVGFGRFPEFLAVIDVLFLILQFVVIIFNAIHAEDVLD